MEHAEAHLYPAARFFSPASERTWRDNPAFRFFGKRLCTDQSLPEFLNELLLIFFSPKRLAAPPHTSLQACFPPHELLRDPDGHRLEYAPAARLNIKLFAFFGASRLNARHTTHREHFEELQQRLLERLHTEDAYDKPAILRDLENLFLGLRSTGEGRTWCAQQFLPLCQHLLTAETIWGETKGKFSSCWNDALSFFSNNKYAFMAHGGDVLYYQLCLALGKQKEEIAQWNEDAGLGLTPEERDPEALRIALEQALPELLNTCPGLDGLASLVCDLEKDTAARTDMDRDGPRYQSMGWCAAASWREGYLFAIELLRVLRADIDIMDRLTLLETACGLHILRTLSARTAALTDQNLPWPGYLLPITATEEKNTTLRSVSQHACRRLRFLLDRLILDQLPNCAYEPKSTGRGANTTLEEAKKKYLGDEVSKNYVVGLYFAIAKNHLGLVVPRSGTGERFVLSERILRLLVLTLIPSQKHLSLETFKRRIRAWHGFDFDAEGLEETQRWLSGKTALFPTRCDSWLRDMLEDGNFLIPLSDACSLVRNPIAESREA